MSIKKKPLLFWLFFVCNGIFFVLFLMQWLFPALSYIRLLDSQNTIRLNIITRQEQYINNIAYMEYYMPTNDITSLIAYTKTIAHNHGLYIHSLEKSHTARDVLYEDIITITHGEMIFLSSDINNLHEFLANLPTGIYIRRLTFEHEIAIRLAIEFVIISS